MSRYSDMDPARSCGKSALSRSNRTACSKTEGNLFSVSLSVAGRTPYPHSKLLRYLSTFSQLGQQAPGHPHKSKTAALVMN
jgi:hypothetical protein